MESKSKFSIIVPVYNVEQYLSYCLSTIINQTMMDIEIICVNDGSTDNSLAIIQEFAERDNRIQIISKKNGGLSSARNAGLAVATGEYILFVDSDDMLCENACDVLYREILERRPDVIVFGTEIFPQCGDNEDKRWLDYILQVENKYYNGDSINALFNERASKPFVWNECYKNESLKKNSITFDEEIRFGEDMVFIFEVFPKVHSISYISNKLYKYRYVREESLMAISRENKEWRLKAHMLIVEKIFDYWNKNNLIQVNEDVLYKWCIDFIGNDIADKTVDENVRRNAYKQLIHIKEKYGLSTVRKNKETKRIEMCIKNAGL